MWVKPPHAKCSAKWKKGVVIGINSENNVEIDGMHRHILNLWRVAIGEKFDDVEGVSKHSQEDGVANVEPEMNCAPLENVGLFVICQIMTLMMLQVISGAVMLHKFCFMSVVLFSLGSCVCVLDCII